MMDFRSFACSFRFLFILGKYWMYIARTTFFCFMGTEYTLNKDDSLKIDFVSLRKRKESPLGRKF